MLVGAVAWGLAFSWATSFESDPGWTLTVSVSLAFLLVMPLQIVRWIELRVVHPRDTRRVDTNVPVPRPLQFSLRQMLEWMTVLAILLGTIRYARSGMPPELERPAGWLLFLCVMGIWAALQLALLLPALWALLGRERPAIRWSTLAVVLLLMIAACLTLVDNPRERTSMAIVAVTDTLLLVASLAVVRVAGYRLTRNVDSAPMEPIP